VFRFWSVDLGTLLAGTVPLALPGTEGGRRPTPAPEPARTNPFAGLWPARLSARHRYSSRQSWQLIATAKVKHTPPTEVAVVLKRRHPHECAVFAERFTVACKTAQQAQGSPSAQR